MFNRGGENLANCSKVAGCSHVRIFLAIEIAEKIVPKNRRKYRRVVNGLNKNLAPLKYVLSY